MMIKKEKTKVLFAESNGDFVDILLSFLTMPLGRVVKILDKHYGAEETPVIECLNTFYNSLANLDSSHFWTDDAKHILLNPISSFDTDYRRLKLDISTDCRHENLFSEQCSKLRFRGIVYDDRAICDCGFVIQRDASRKLSQADRGNGLFIVNTATFISSDDLQIVSDAKGLVQTVSILNIAGIEGVEFVNVTVGLGEIMDLLRASMISRTPLSDVLLNKTRQMNSIEVEYELETTLALVEKEENPNSNKMILKVTVQKSTNKLLFDHAKKDFVEFLFSLLAIPLGGVEWLLSNKSSIKSIDNLYKSNSYLIDDNHFKSSCIKNRLIKQKLPCVYTSTNQILPLTEEESLPDDACEDISAFSYIIFPQGRGKYIYGPRLYQVMDDLTVKPFYVSSILFSLGLQMISLSDLKEVEIEIGLKEALSILKASLTSNSALTNGQLNHQPEQDI